MKSTLFITVLLIAAATAISARHIDAEKSKKPSNNKNNSGEWLASGGGGFNIPGLGNLGDESTTQEVQHYWHLKTHSNKPLPPVFLSKLSALSPSEMIAINSAVSNGDRFPLINKLPLLHIPLSYHPPSLSYNLSVLLHVPLNYIPPTLSYNHSVLLHVPLNYIPPTLSYNHSVDGDTTTSANAKSATRRSGFDSIWRGLFFRESLLKEGTTVPLLKFASIRSNQYFLPRSIASKIPFSVDAVRKIFNISANSAMYRAIDSTIDQCKMPPNIGESKKCVTSAEDMIDYTLSTLGANTDIQGWSTHNWSGFRGKSSVIGKLKVVYDGKLTGKQQLSCHQVPFPYLLHNCHSVSGTVIYDMEILDMETKEKINQAVAVCHMDTSAWDPNHVAFAVLGTTPGKTEVCHWVVPWEMTFTG